MNNFEQLNRLLLYVLSIVNKLEMSARRTGEDIFALSLGIGLIG